MCPRPHVLRVHPVRHPLQHRQHRGGQGEEGRAREGDQAVRRGGRGLDRRPCRRVRHAVGRDQRIPRPPQRDHHPRGGGRGDGALRPLDRDHRRDRRRPRPRRRRPRLRAVRPRRGSHDDRRRVPFGEPRHGGGRASFVVANPTGTTCTRCCPAVRDRREDAHQGGEEREERPCAVPVLGAAAGGAPRTPTRRRFQASRFGLETASDPTLRRGYSPAPDRGVETHRRRYTGKSRRVVVRRRRLGRRPHHLR